MHKNEVRRADARPRVDLSRQRCFPGPSSPKPTSGPSNHVEPVISEPAQMTLHVRRGHLYRNFGVPALQREGDSI